LPAKQHAPLCLPYLRLSALTQKRLGGWGRSSPSTPRSTTCWAGPPARAHVAASQVHQRAADRGLWGRSCGAAHGRGPLRRVRRLAAPGRRRRPGGGLLVGPGDGLGPGRRQRPHGLLRAHAQEQPGVQHGRCATDARACSGGPARAGSALARARALALRQEARGHALSDDPTGGARALDAARDQAAASENQGEANIARPRRTLFPSRTDWEVARTAAELDSTASQDMHAGELEVSLLLHAYPELVGGDYRAADHRADPRPHLLVTGMRGYTDSGVIGLPSQATADKGRAILDSLTRSFKPPCPALLGCQANDDTRPACDACIPHRQALACFVR
jgi:Creatinine amidohydrolase